MEIIDAIDLFSQYLTVEKGLSLNTVNSYLDDLKRFFMYFKDKKEVSELSPYDLNSFVNYELNSGLTVPTALRRLSSIRSFYSFLKKEGYYEGELPEVC